MMLKGARLLSFCAFLLFGASSIQAQPVLNGSFEEWGEYDPIGWTTANEPSLYLPVTRSERAIDSMYSVHIQVLDSTDQRLAPFTFVGTNDNFGFPIVGKPVALEGYISTNFKGTDFLNILAFMIRKGSLIGSGSVTITENFPEFTRFSIPIDYFGDVEPDLGRIAFVLGESPCTFGSEVWIDGLEYKEASSVSTDIVANNFAITYSAHGMTFTIVNAQSTFSTFEVLDVHGHVIETLYTGVTGGIHIPWEGRGLTNGMYFARLTRPDGIEVRKVILSK